MATVFRPPLIGRAAALSGAAALSCFTVNLLVTTLAPPAPLPFNQTDWTVPARPQHPIALRTLAQSVPLTLSTFIQPRQTDWPVPRGPIPSIALRTHVESLKLNLLGQDKFFGVGGPEYDYPNPKGYQRSVELLTFAPPIPLSLATFVQPVPTKMSDWPVPRGYVPGISLRTHIDPLKLNLLGQDKFYGLGGPDYDWPNPRGYQRSIDLLTFAPPLPLTTATFVQPVPTKQTDWPVPRGPIPSIALRTHVDPLKLNLRGQDKFFGVGGPEYDYPNPKGYRRAVDLLTFAPPIPLTLATFIQPKPFKQMDWPVPRGYPRPVAGIQNPIQIVASAGGAVTVTYYYRYVANMGGNNV